MTYTYAISHVIWIALAMSGVFYIILRYLQAIEKPDHPLEGIAYVFLIGIPLMIIVLVYALTMALLAYGVNKWHDGFIHYRDWKELYIFSLGAVILAGFFELCLSFLAFQVRRFVALSSTLFKVLQLCLDALAAYVALRIVLSQSFLNVSLQEHGEFLLAFLLAIIYFLFETGPSIFKSKKKKQ
ncbi:hypothetical protein A374_16108 [Fictibacillus macauensis ZFHKF-1]|uniref:Uncharacterized protein n=1 Tax=Fictibacillus macauensis ZFHKF-1 TaxID=1196324 RepID=I8IXV7_9BACL|nr:hypothetical protein [Fictibacillus macauensis]EIT84326.1 hypothetical protein A374_16108 [Fictibacillus macauensis ZFHKF-1]